jgi:hypothetical protein
MRLCATISLESSKLPSELQPAREKTPCTTLLATASVVSNFFFCRFRDRVHVALMEESSQDQVMQRCSFNLGLNSLTNTQGWGVFALEYRVDGPLVAILDAASHKLYVCLLNFTAAGCSVQCLRST